MKVNGFSQVAGGMLSLSWLKKSSFELSWPSWRPSWANFSAEVGPEESWTGLDWAEVGPEESWTGPKKVRRRAGLGETGPK